MKTADYRNMIDHAKQQCPLEADNSIYGKYVRKQTSARVSYTLGKYR